LGALVVGVAVVADGAAAALVFGALPGSLSLLLHAVSDARTTTTAKALEGCMGETIAVR
jgi:hypothetical protein